MSELKRLLDPDSASPAARGLSGAKSIRAALSLGRIVLINVLAMAVTAGVTIHVYTRPARPKPPAALAAPLIDVDLETVDPVVAPRAPAAPIVNDGAGRAGSAPSADPHAPTSRP